MHVLRRLRFWFVALGATLTLVAASHALRDKSEPGHEHSRHGALVSCVVTLALVGATLWLLHSPRRVATLPPTRRLLFAASAAPAVRIVSNPRTSPAWLGRFRR